MKVLYRISFVVLWFVAAGTVSGPAAAMEIVSDTTWSAATVPNLLNESVYIRDGATLTIDAGVSIRAVQILSALRVSFDVNSGGALIAEGTAGAPITFTSAEAAPAPGDWGRIHVRAGGTCVLTHCNLRYGGDDGQGSVLLESSNAQVTNCAIQDGLGSGLDLNSPGIAPQIDGLSVINCDHAGIRFAKTNVQPDIGDSLSFTGNGFDAILVEGGTISNITSWPVRGTPYAVRGSVAIEAPASLIIGPGVEVRFVTVISALRSNLRARLGGDIQVAGTVSEPVVFTSWEAEPAPGDWAHIRIDADSSGDLEHFSMAYGGDDGRGSLYIQSSAITVNNGVIRHSQGDAIRLDTAHTTPSLDGLTIESCTGSAIKVDPPDIQPVIGNALAFTNNGTNAIHIMGGDITQSTDWTVNGTPYAVSSTLRVTNNAVLTIEPGVDVRFAYVISALRSNLQAIDGGKIYAPGIEANPVRFGALADPPAPGDWAYVRVAADGRGDFAYCEFSHGGDDDRGTLWVQSSDTLIANCTIRDSLADGVYLDTATITPEMDALTVEDCGDAAVQLSIPDIQPVIGSDLSFTGNGIDAIHLFGGTMAHDTSWSTTGAPYAISGHLMVENGATLTIGPAVDVRLFSTLSAARSLIHARTGGQLLMEGTAAAPIQFSSAEHEPAPGDWGHIRVAADASATMDHLVIRDAGDDSRGALWVQTSNASIHHCLIESSSADGLYLDTPGTSPTFDALQVRDCDGAAVMLADPNIQPFFGDDLLFTGNGKDLIQVSSGAITLNTTWSTRGAPYGVLNGLLISAGAELEVGPGVRVAFLPTILSERSRIDIGEGSSLRAAGTSAAPIYFTSAKDTPSPGDWSNLSVEPGGSASFDHCVVEFGGHRGEMIEVDDGSLALSNSLVRNSLTSGVRASNPRAAIFDGNHILDNADYGLVNDTPATVLDATMTWWGDPSGPYHATLNPDGLGNRVSDGVTFEPWVRSLAPDVTPPVLTLVGPESIELECGVDEYIEYGVTAIDEIDGDLSEEVSVDVSVVTKEEPATDHVGTYLVTYTVSDHSGNAASPVSRTVTVADNTAPAITLNGPAYVEIDCGATYTDEGATATDACADGVSVVSDTSVVDTDTPGTYTVSFFATDPSGNEAETVGRTVVVLDNCVTGDCDDVCSGPPVDADGDGLDACQECLNGTDDTLTDTEADGMPDGFEVTHALDPLYDDADEDLDEDGLTNLEEFLRDSLPEDPNSPNGLYFVSPPPLGVDNPAGGTTDAPWATIVYALTQVSPSAGETARIVLAEGLYVEDVVLWPRISLAGTLAGERPVIRGRVLGSQDSALLNLVVEPVVDQAGEVLVEMDNAALDLFNVVLRGRGKQLTTGILVNGTEPSGSLIVGCTFSDLAVGVDIESAIPTIRRCTFNSIGIAGVIVRRPLTKSAAGNLGDATDARTGWNSFEAASIDGFAVVNEREEVVLMENNEWGSDHADGVAATIDGPSDFVPFLGVGKSLAVSSLFCTVWDADTQVRVTNASVRLSPSALRPVTENERGVYAFPALAPAAYNLIVEAPGCTAVEVAVAIPEGDVVSVTVPMSPAGSDPTGPSCRATAHHRARWAGDAIAMFFAAIAIMWTVSRGRQRTRRRII